MKLNIGERIRVEKLLPKEANFSTWKIIRDLENELSFSEKETKSCNIRDVMIMGELFTKWDDETFEKEVKFGEITTKMVVDKLKKLEEGGKLTKNDIPLYEKFVENKK